MSKRVYDKVEGLLHGGDYNPEQWLDHPEILKEDIQFMKQAGINCVTLGVFSWSTYEPEDKAVMIAYASMYGNTEAAAQALAGKLVERGITNTVVYDVSNTHVSYLISEAFRVSHIVLASVTYNMGIYPVMHNFLADMKALNLQNRMVALVENGSWAVKSGDLMQKFLDEEMKQMTVLNQRLSMASSLPGSKENELDQLADAIADSVREA